MSKAFRCDRCKQCFDPYEIKDPKYFITIKGYFCQNGSQFDGNEYGYAEFDDIHLCPSCSEKFARFWDTA